MVLLHLKKYEEWLLVLQYKSITDFSRKLMKNTFCVREKHLFKKKPAHTGNSLSSLVFLFYKIQKFIFAKKE